jgi:hypothetical protein
MAGDPIPDTEKRLIQVLSVFEDLFENAIGNDLIEPVADPIVETVVETVAPATKKGK